LGVKVAKKRINGSRKGGKAERDVSRDLSLWWSNGESDDFFWRSAGSGGRATNRAKKGKSTMNACGDLRAECSEAQKLLDLITIEIKEGYGDACVADIWEKKTKGGFHAFIRQAREAASRAGTIYYAVIHKRNYCQRIIYIGSFRDSQQHYVSSLEDFLTPANRDYWLRQWEENFAEKNS
jgi:hypothetical protein